MRLVTLRNYIDNCPGSWLEATVKLERPEQSLRTRLASGKDWRVGKVDGNWRCILVDTPPKRS